MCIRKHISTSSSHQIQCEQYLYIQAGFHLTGLLVLQRVSWRQMRTGLALLEEKLSTEQLHSLETDFFKKSPQD